MKETELAEPVAQWMREAGYTVYAEVPFYNRCIDMVGLKNGAVRVVELKVNFAVHGMYQAVRCRMATSDLFLAVGKRPLERTLTKYERYGVGILLVNGSVHVLREPSLVVKPWPAASKHLRDNCEKSGPSDEAGLPCMSGCGPAQAVLSFVKAYVSEHPKASWAEIYSNVTNHYSSAKSMACAMSGYLGMPLWKIRENDDSLLSRD